LTHELCELLWLRIILNDLKVTYEEPMILYYDNKLAIALLTIQFSIIGPNSVLRADKY